MATYKIGGAQFREMFNYGASLLDSRKQEINQLNVFPVPDGDTGVNMSLTVLSSCREIARIENPTVANIADGIAKGALKGARGNSGVILSQLFRGFARGSDALTELDTVAMAQAMRVGVDTAYKAVMKPREGTILTVSRLMAEEASRIASQTPDMLEFLRQVLAAGQESLRRTPDMLEVLKKAGVVDAGGMGLLVIYEGYIAVLEGKKQESIQEIKPETTVSAPAMQSTNAVFNSDQEIEFGYCTELFITELKDGIGEDEAMAFRDKLAEFGDSIVVIYDSGIIKVHCHSEAPDRILHLALELGSLDNIKVENMRTQHQDMMGLEAQAQGEVTVKSVEVKAAAMVTVASGQGLRDIFADLMVDGFVEGGQTMNPSVEDIAQAIQKANAKTVFVLPNNSNIILTAQQASQLVECDVRVIPTKYIPQGIAAALNFDPDSDPDEMEKVMNDAIAAVKSGEVTYAVRDTTIDEYEIKQGDIMGIGPDGICSVNGDINKTSVELVQKLAGNGCDIISIYYGADIEAEKAQELKAELEGLFPNSDVEAYYGGQPVYYYIISVE